MVAPVVECLRSLIFSALNCSPSVMSLSIAHVNCETSLVLLAGWSGGFSRGSSIFAPPSNWLGSKWVKQSWRVVKPKYKKSEILFEPPHDKTNKMACAPSEDSDQPGQPPSLIRVFAVRMKKAQADQSLRWADSHFVGFVMRWLIYSVCEVF